MEASFCGADKGSFKDAHFTTEAFMMAGQKLLEAVLVNWNVPLKDGSKPKEHKDLNQKALERELTANRKLISMTMGQEGNSSGSDSEPSADNLDEEELGKIVPIKIVKKEPPKVKEKKPVPPKKMAPLTKKPQSPTGRR